AGDLPQGFLASVLRQAGVEARNRRPQPPGQQHLSVTAALSRRLAGRDDCAGDMLPAQRAQGAKHGVFEVEFVKTSHNLWDGPALRVGNSFIIRAYVSTFSIPSLNNLVPIQRSRHLTFPDPPVFRI